MLLARVCGDWGVEGGSGVVTRWLRERGVGDGRWEVGFNRPPIRFYKGTTPCDCGKACTTAGNCVRSTWCATHLAFCSVLRATVDALAGARSHGARGRT